MLCSVPFITVILNVNQKGCTDEKIVDEPELKSYTPVVQAVTFLVLKRKDSNVGPVFRLNFRLDLVFGISVE